MQNVLFPLIPPELNVNVVKDLFCLEKYKTLTASLFETGLYSVKLCKALNTTDEKGSVCP